MNDEAKKVELCEACEKNPAKAPHSCPFATEMGGFDSEHCNCCDECRLQCRMDI